MTDGESYCFFDVDETLVTFKTMLSFQRYYMSRVNWSARLLGPLRARLLQSRLSELEREGLPRESINREYYRFFRGHAALTVRAQAAAWYRATRAKVLPFYHPATLSVLHAHRDAGRKIVFVSGSAVDVLMPIAAEVGAEHVLATRLCEHGGYYTGEIVPPQTIGAGKAKAVRAFLEERGADARVCFAYGDHPSDFEMLAVVGHPFVVSRDGARLAEARRRGFGTIDLAQSLTPARLRRCAPSANPTLEREF